jgi:hypothetical protein
MVPDGVMGYFRVVLHPLNTIHGQPTFHPEMAGFLRRVCVLFRFSPWGRMNPADIHVMLISMSEGKYIGEGCKWQQTA